MKYFLFTVGSVCRIKWFTSGSKNSLKDVRKLQMMPDQAWKWLRQRSKGFHAADGTNVSMLVENITKNKRLFQV
jgi:hypothetical protein